MLYTCEYFRFCPIYNDVFLEIRLKRKTSQYTFFDKYGKHPLKGTLSIKNDRLLRSHIIDSLQTISLYFSMTS